MTLKGALSQQESAKSRRDCPARLLRRMPLAQAAEAFLDAVVGIGDREADEAFAHLAVAAAGSDDDTDFVDHARRVLGRGPTVGQSSPDVEAAFRLLDAHAEVA